MDQVIEATALAKVNLALHVTARRENGYHDLESLVVFADFGDELTARPAQSDSVRLSGPFAGALTPGQTNLVTKAVDAFRQRWPDAVPHGVEISLAKNLPVAAGIGGGSADAAAALRLMAGFAQQDGLSVRSDARRPGARCRCAGMPLFAAMPGARHW